MTTKEAADIIDNGVGQFNAEESILIEGRHLYLMFPIIRKKCMNS